MRFIYNIIIQLFSLAVRISSLYSSKSALMVRGWKDWRKKLSAGVGVGEKWLWMHCASLGEFEQGRPVIEEIKKRSPATNILLTFFSPSGYEVRKNYGGADHICYLPPDTAANARDFMRIVRPETVIFVKYEFWNNYISAVHKAGVRFYMISAIFRPGQHFFRWYGGFFRNMLGRFTKIFVQDSRSADLLNSAGIYNYAIAGDTRFDRVMQISSAARTIEAIESFAAGHRVFLAGSSWSPDEEIIAEYINNNAGRMKWIFAPHEVDPENIERLEKLFSADCVRFSAYKESPTSADVMIIDNIGMLSSAYRYAYIAAVGGGFGKGIHNILEPACWGIPVLFGPNHRNFREALEMQAAGGACSFSSYYEFKTVLDRWLDDDDEYRKASSSAGDFVRKNTGATGIIIAELFEKDINTNG